MVSMKKRYLERPIEEVQRDLDGGYVSRQGAERDYGGAVGGDGRIDAAASEALRNRRAHEPEAAQ